MASVDELHQLVVVDVHLSGFGQQCIDALGEDLHSFPAVERRALIGDVGAGGFAFFDDARGFELAVSTGDRVRIDEEPLGERADGGSSSPG